MKPVISAKNAGTHIVEVPAPTRIDAFPSALNMAIAELLANCGAPTNFALPPITTLLPNVPLFEFGFLFGKLFFTNSFVTKIASSIVV